MKIDHLHQAENAQSVHLDCPRIKRCGFDVEDDEQHRDQVEANRETPRDRRRRLDPALIGFAFMSDSAWRAPSSPGRTVKSSAAATRDTEVRWRLARRDSWLVKVFTSTARHLATKAAAPGLDRRRASRTFWYASPASISFVGALRGKRAPASW